MYLLEQIKQISNELSQHKLRSCMAMFGIIWGTISVILLMSLGQSFIEANSNSLLSITNGTLLLNIGKRQIRHYGGQSGQAIHLRALDILALKKHVSGIQAMAPNFTHPENLTVNTLKTKASVTGTTDDLKIAYGLNIAAGRFLDREDIAAQRYVVFLGDKIKENLFGKKNPLGKKVFIRGIPFTVIGDMPPSTGIQVFGWTSRMAMIPYTTFLNIYGDQDVAQVVFVPTDINAADSIKQKIRLWLSKKFNFAPDDPNAVQIFDFGEARRFFIQFFLGIQIFLGICGALTLAVGGLGVANILFLIVAERTPEIGLRVALGAKYHDILQQFLLEGAFIIGLGGGIGFLISCFFVEILQWVTLPQWLGKVQISWIVAFCTILFLSLIGFAAAFFPARRAAKLDPIIALYS